MAKRLEAASGGAFFLWVGYALLVELPIGVGLIGIGAITLVTQAVRKSLDLPLEGFWVFVGLGFLIGGFWTWYAVDIPLAPILLLAVGTLLIGAALLRNRWGGDHERPRGSSAN